MNHENRFDILRLMAAWGVLYFHTYPLLGSKQTDLITENWKYDTLGGVSVSIFFVISGYLVTNSITTSTGALDFLKKRALRIYPALLFVTLISVFILGPVVTSLPILEFFSEKTTWNYLKNAIGYNIKYELPGVFANNHMFAVNVSLWSLNLEIKAYLGLLFLWLLPFEIKKKLIITCIFLSAAYFVRPVSEYGLNNRWFGLSFFAAKYFLMFAIGGLLSTYKDKLDGQVLKMLGSASLLLIAFLSFIDVQPMTSLLYHWFFAVACIWISKNWLFLPVISSKVGDLSYGVYLFSFPVQQTLIQYGFQDKPIPMFIFVSTVVTIVFALISWHFVEKPFLKSKASSKARAHA
jgi:peptidoglycan/LPS O-acetylase OafA/YrhL